MSRYTAVSREEPDRQGVVRRTTQARITTASPSSSLAQDPRFSIWKHGFESRRGHHHGWTSGYPCQEPPEVAWPSRHPRPGSSARTGAASTWRPSPRARLATPRGARPEEGATAGLALALATPAATSAPAGGAATRRSTPRRCKRQATARFDR